MNGHTLVHLISILHKYLKKISLDFKERTLLLHTYSMHDTYICTYNCVYKGTTHIKYKKVTKWNALNTCTKIHIYIQWIIWKNARATIARTPSIVTCVKCARVLSMCRICACVCVFCAFKCTSWVLKICPWGARVKYLLVFYK